MPQLAGEWILAEDIAPVRYIAKSATETVSASTTMQNDDDFLLVPLAANKTYRVEVRLSCQATAVNANIKTQFVLAGGAAQKAARHVMASEVATTSTAATLMTLPVSNVTGVVTSGITNGTSGVTVHYEFLLETTTSGTAGTFTMQWAQGTATGTTSLTPSSYMIITEVEAV